MTTLNLNSLIADLEASTGLQKTASDAGADVKPAVSQELASILEKKASDDLTKQAFAQGEALAKELLAKLANEIIENDAALVADDNKKVVDNATGGSVEGVLQATVDQGLAGGATTDDRVNHETQITGVEIPGAPVDGEKQTSTNKETTEMNKTASNQDLAKTIMEKLAQEFTAQTTTPAAAEVVAAAPVPNMMQRDTAQMTAEHDAIVQGVVPGGDGSVNALFETIVAKAKAEGGQSDDLINGPGAVQEMYTQGIDEAREKAAAVSALCDEGMDFDTAVSLVKQAEEELLAEAWEQEKKAAFGMLLDQGVDFDVAVNLIKEAEQDLINQVSK